MNIFIKRIILILAFILSAIQFDANAVEMKTSCVDEPVFSSKVCVHQANPDKDNTIVLIHGLNDNAGKNWGSQIKALSQYYHIVAIDMPGFQFSEQGEQNYSPEKYVQLISFITEHYGLEKFDLLGHSMGGAVSVLYAATYPEKVKRLVLVDVAGILHRLSLGKSFIAFVLSFYGEDTSNLETYAAKIMMKYDWLYSIFRGEIARQNGQSRAVIEMLDYDYSSALDRIRSDTLIIWGKQDEVAPLRTAKVLQRRIANSSLEVFDGATHSPMVQKPNQFNIILLSFLQDNYPKRKKDLPGKDSGIKELGVCKGETGKHFSGRYKKLVIQNCRDVRIINAKVGELVVTESRVVIENSTIGGKVPVALASVGSDIKITSSTIWGASAIKTARSRFDLAAVDIDYQDNIITGESGSQFIFSVSRLKKDFNSRSIHGVVKTGAGNYPTIEISSKLDEVIEGVNKAFGWE